ncbi:MAG: hypothetical protein AB8B83_04985 [Bdellovibrionales bacterium]
MALLSFAVLFFSTMPVFAQQTVNTLCQQLSQYIPIDTVEFNPGFSDVPADIQRIQDPVLGSISIPIEIDLVEFFDNPELKNLPGFLLEPEVSNIEINQDGAVFYNGQEISEDIQRVCGSSDNSGVQEIAKPKRKPSKKSSVRITNGSAVVISNTPENSVKEKVPFPALKPKAIIDKSKARSENSIDVEVLKAQDNEGETVIESSDKDLILEGQYP